MTQACILIVEDEQLVREVLAAVLADGCYRLEFATCGEEALTLATELRPDLILLDVMMPGMNGYEVCRRIRSAPDLALIPILMLTALDDAASRLEGINAGADDFLSKPFDRAELRARVGTIIRLNRYRKLIEEKERFLRLAEMLPHGIVLLDANARIRFANPALAGLLGVSRAEDLLERNFMALLAGFRDVEAVLKRSDGSSFSVAIDGVRYPAMSEPMTQLVVRDTTEQRQYLAALEREAYQQRSAGAAYLATVRRMEGRSRQLLETQEFERRMLARELHDEIGQQLGALKLHLRVLGRGANDAQQISRLAECLEIVDATIAAIRNRALELRPSMLDDFGLQAALDWYCSRQAERSGASIEVVLDGLEQRPSPDVETACFRIVQEAVNNALRHGESHQIAIRLSDLDQQIALRIQDDGRGFMVPTVQAGTAGGAGFGISSMRERAELLGGSFSITSTPGVGTLVEAMIPLS
jgi:signal transduction histidine kinase